MQNLIELKLEQLSPLIKNWYSPEKLRSNVTEALEEEFQRLDDQDFAQGYFEHCQIAGTTPQDYLNHLDGETLTGIRFWNRDLDRPFVDAVLVPELPNQPAGYLQLARGIAAHHAIFQPRHVRFFVPSHLDLGPLPEGFLWEKRYLALPFREARSHPRPQRFEDVTLHVPENLDFHEDYLQMYRDIAVLRPEHPEYATPETREDFEEMRQAGTLFQVFHQDQWIGVMAGSPAAEQGLSGYVVMEMLIRPEFQGKGLGEAAQRHLLERLPAQPDDVLFGTIDARNTSAIRAALKNHRQDVGGYLWVKV
ncbi:GNAT family N-acetyltransferase [Deinococcus roseus]|uniref:N-acetyltransferase domain-containing protein n=1 Tax=Deinococcus roseus TaxID=392414 RepID=A0ABQ2CUV4_9DEIO|nr:GNAT family N-acetyltransferase [Deinococcus roseus]GGJ22712.1 hypothetical protein GCM10008938_06150 [Deinococcus roseus]